MDVRTSSYVPVTYTTDGNLYQSDRMDVTWEQDGYRSQHHFRRTAEAMERKSMGLQGVSKMYQGRARFSGSLDEDLTKTIRVNRTIKNVCNLSDQEMDLGVPIILDGDALSYFTENLRDELSFEEIVKRLHSEYTSEEQRNRLLRTWQKTSLVEMMRNSPDESEVAVFKNMCSMLASTHYMRIIQRTDS